MIVRDLIRELKSIDPEGSAEVCFSSEYINDEESVEIKDNYIIIKKKLNKIPQNIINRISSIKVPKSLNTSVEPDYYNIVVLTL